MTRFVTWWNTPVKPRRRGWVLLAIVLNTVAVQLRDRRMADLRKRVEALEGQRRHDS